MFARVFQAEDMHVLVQWCGWCSMLSICILCRYGKPLIEKRSVLGGVRKLVRMVCALFSSTWQSQKKTSNRTLPLVYWMHILSAGRMHTIERGGASKAIWALPVCMDHFSKRGFSVCKYILCKYIQACACSSVSVPSRGGNQ